MLTLSRGSKLGDPGALAVRLAADTPLALEQEVPHTVLTNSVYPAGPRGCRAVRVPGFQPSFLALLTSRVLRSLAQVPWTSPGHPLPWEEEHLTRLQPCRNTDGRLALR